MWSYVGVDCFFKKNNPPPESQTAAVGCQKEEGEMKCVLASFLCGSKVPCLPPPLPISLFLSRTASSPCQTQKKKKKFRCEAKLQIWMRNKHTKTAPFCLSASFQEISGTVCNYLLFKCWLKRCTHRSWMWIFNMCVGTWRTIIFFVWWLIRSSRLIKVTVISWLPLNAFW